MKTRDLCSLLAAASAVYLVQRLARRSGATQAEVYGALPGDDIVPHPMLETTRAITIHAPVEAVWPWVAQMGYHRGGWYTNAWLDKLIWHIENPSAERVLPEYQRVLVGDIIPDGPEGTARYTVAAVEPGHLLALYDGDGTHIPSVKFSWVFILRKISPTTTRFIVRTRATFAPDPWHMALAYVLSGPSDFIMARLMLMRGIKRRAERANGKVDHIPPPVALGQVATATSR